MSEDERTLFVTNRWSNTLAAIDTATMKVQRTAPSREDATRLYRYRDGRIVVSNYGARSLSIVDQQTLAELAHVPTGAREVMLEGTAPLASGLYFALHRGSNGAVETGRVVIVH